MLGLKNVSIKMYIKIWKSKKNMSIVILFAYQIVFLELVYTHAKFHDHTSQDHSMFNFLSLFTRFSIDNGEKENDNNGCNGFVM